MDAVTYLKEKKRMCEEINDCNRCPLYQTGGIACMLFERDYPEEAVEYVERYQETGQAEESRWMPISKTYRERFEEMSRRKQTVIGMLKDMATGICEKCCKWPDIEENEEALAKHCWDCPLNKLGD